MAGMLQNLKSRAGGWIERGVPAEGPWPLGKTVRDEWWPWLLGWIKLPGSALMGYWYWIEWGHAPVAITIALAFYVSARQGSFQVASNAPDVSARPLQTPAVATPVAASMSGALSGSADIEDWIKKEFARIEGKFGENFKTVFDVANAQRERNVIEELKRGFDELEKNIKRD